MYNNDYIDQGVIIKPNVISEGDNVTLAYNGLLAKSGAEHVYAHVGYGDSSNWQNTSYFKMNRTPDGFETDFNVNKLSNLQVAFKDCASNWDNNSGNNYVFNVQTR